VSSPAWCRCSGSCGGCISCRASPAPTPTLKPSPTQREATAAIFRAFHQYLGVGVGEHLGYLLTGLWSILTGIAIVLGDTLVAWLGWPGIVIGAGIAICSAEFLGPNEQRGSALAGAATPMLYIAWSIWLLALGIAVII
jgi:hypothetical protein